ncbi:uncharacterized protein LOC142645143 isoform X1 [Dermatophagoides pteronyssinus]|uniref:uncharacterized protein LOC142645143 isoform X1 n=1 Tax=Dermatophagoides pteronyssinus TaxID=6956 RepID=UPI003F68159E
MINFKPLVHNSWLVVVCGMYCLSAALTIDDGSKSNYSWTNRSDFEKFLCETINEKDHQFNILTIGLTKTKFLLLTTDFYVYEADIDEVKTNIDKLYLRTKPVHLSNKYPNLWNNKFFQQKLDLFDEGVIIVDNDAWLCFISNNVINKGIQYNLDKDLVISGWSYINHEVLISTSEKNSLYSIRKDKIKGQLQMQKLRLSGTTMMNNYGLTTVFSYRNMCWFDYPLQKQIFFSQNDCYNLGMSAIDLPILKGFVVNYKFYLFTKDTVYSFGEQAIIKFDNPYPILKHSYKAFFLCPGKLPYPFIQYASRIVWLVLLSILILLILLCLILYLYFKTSKPKEPTIKSSNHSKSIRSTVISNVEQKSEKIK